MADDAIDSSVPDISSDLPDSSDSVELPSDDLSDSSLPDLPDDSSSDNEIDHPEIPVELPSDESLEAPSPDLPEDPLPESEPPLGVSEIFSQEKQDISSSGIEPELPVDDNSSSERDDPFQGIGGSQDMTLSGDDMQNSLTDNTTEPSLPDEPLSNQDSYGEPGTSVREKNKPSVYDVPYSITDNEGLAVEPHLPENEPIPATDVRHNDVVTDTHDNAAGQPSMEMPTQDSGHFGSGMDENALSASDEHGHEAISDQNATSSSLESVYDDVNGTAIGTDEDASANSRVDALSQNQTDSSLSEMEITEQTSLEEENNPEQQTSATGASEAGPGVLQSTLSSSGSTSRPKPFDKPVDAEQEDIDKFVRGLEEQVQTPEQYLEQKRAEYAVLDAENSGPVDNHSVPNGQNANSKTVKLVYEGTDPDLIDSTKEEKIREYRIGSPHEDFEVHKGILEADERYKIGLSARTNDGSLVEALNNLSDANRVNQGSAYLDTTDEYFHDKYGHAPYTDAYPQLTPAGAIPSNDTQLAIDDPSTIQECPLQDQQECDADGIRRVMNNTIESTNDIKDFDSKDARQNLYQRAAVGTLAEQLCYETTGSQNLNELTSNFPWADGITPTEIQQVKSHVNTSVSNAMGAYAKDFSNSLGGGEDSKIDGAVDKLWKMRSTEKWGAISKNLPPEIVTAESKESLKTAMLDKIVLRIPMDDVPKLQDYVRIDALKGREKYGLKDPSEADVEKLVEKIKPIAPNIDNHQLRLMARDVFQRKMEKAAYPRGVAYAKHLRESDK